MEDLHVTIATTGGILGRIRYAEVRQGEGNRSVLLATFYWPLAHFRARLYVLFLTLGGKVRGR
jgi:hypothetical protein